MGRGGEEGDGEGGEGDGEGDGEGEEEGDGEGGSADMQGRNRPIERPSYRNTFCTFLRLRAVLPGRFSPLHTVSASRYICVKMYRRCFYMRADLSGGFKALSRRSPFLSLHNG